MSISFEESELMFGPFNESDLFRVEKSNAYLAIQEHTKIAEFLWISNQSKLWIVEAKSSIPKPNTQEYEVYFEEIKYKLTNAITFTINALLQRHIEAHKELPDAFRKVLWAKLDFKLVLVIPLAPEKQLPAMTDKLRITMRNTRKPWKIEEISINVLNKEQAIKFGLATAT